MAYAVRVTWSSGKSEEFRGEGERADFLLSFFGGSGAVPTDVSVEDLPGKPKARSGGSDGTLAAASPAKAEPQADKSKTGSVGSDGTQAKAAAPKAEAKR